MTPENVHITFDAATADDTADANTWEQQLRASNRPDSLTQKIIALVLLLEAMGERLPRAVRLPKDGPPSGIALQAQTDVTAAVDKFVHSASVALDARAPALVKLLQRYVAQHTGLAAPGDVAIPLERLTSALKQGLLGIGENVGTAAQQVIERWYQNDGTDIAALRTQLADALDGAAWQTKRLARTELQNAYKDSFRDSLRQSGNQRVLREAMPGACDECIGLEGEYDAEDTECYVTHPNCVCTWTVLDSSGHSLGEADEGGAAFTFTLVQRSSSVYGENYALEAV